LCVNNVEGTVAHVQMYKGPIRYSYSTGGQRFMAVTSSSGYTLRLGHKSLALCYPYHNFHANTFVAIAGLQKVFNTNSILSTGWH